MKLSPYLIIKKNGYKGAVRVTKSAPNLDSNEIALRLNIEVPDELFTKPRLEASISVPKGAVSAPVIEADVIDNIEDVIKQKTGLDVNLTLISAKE